MCYAVLSHSVVSDSLQHYGLYNLPGWRIHGDSPDKNTGVGCHALLQGIFPTQRLNSGLPHCRHSLPSDPSGKPIYITNYDINTYILIMAILKYKSGNSNI